MNWYQDSQSQALFMAIYSISRSVGNYLPRCSFSKEPSCAATPRHLHYELAILTSTDALRAHPLPEMYHIFLFCTWLVSPNLIFCILLSPLCLWNHLSYWFAHIFFLLFYFSDCMKTIKTNCSFSRTRRSMFYIIKKRTFGLLAVNWI